MIELRLAYLIGVLGMVAGMAIVFLLIAFGVV